MAIMITINAYAKINLFLHVLDRRPDEFHSLDTVYQAVSLKDRLVFEIDPSLERTMLDLLPHSSFDVPTDEKNLILKTVKFLEHCADKSINDVKIRLTKNIPVGAGLGGGSTDAAATLVALNRLCSLKLETQALWKGAESLGADVPFFLKGGTARGTGKGERIEPIHANLAYAVVIVYPGFAINTAYAYRLLDHARADSHEYADDRSVDVLRAALRNGDFEKFCTALKNDFHPVIEDHYPEIRTVTIALQDAGCPAAMLSGSGASVFGITRSIAQAERVKERLNVQYPYVAVAEPISRGFDIAET